MIALVTQAARVRSLKPRDGRAIPPEGTNSVELSRAIARESRGSAARLGEQLLRTQKRGSSDLPGSTKRGCRLAAGLLAFNEADAGSIPAGPPKKDIDLLCRGLSSNGRPPRCSERTPVRVRAAPPRGGVVLRERRGLINRAHRDRHPATRPRPVRLGGSGRRFLRPDTAVRIRHGSPTNPGVSQQRRARAGRTRDRSCGLICRPGGASPPPAPISLGSSSVEERRSDKPSVAGSRPASRTKSPRETDLKWVCEARRFRVRLLGGVPMPA